MSTPAINTELLEARLKDLKTTPDFKPDEKEARYTVTQSFETGMVVTLSFVIRDGEMIIYDSYERPNIF